MAKLYSLDKLINSLSKLPGVGAKSAERMAYAILSFSDEEIKDFSDSLLDLKKLIHKCPNCGAYIEEEKCPFCLNENRDNSKMMIVSFPKDVITIENSNIFKGTYHVLGGVISSKNLSSENINIEKLIERIKKENISEVILATNPDIDGETTALYISKKLENLGVSITRLGYGLQMGANLDYVDPITLERALEGRKKL